MLTFEDCLALCNLTEKEIAAIAEHEHVPDMLALELGEYLIRSEDGELVIKKMIIDDIKHAINVGNKRHADELQALLKEYVITHPRMKDLVEQKQDG